MDQHVGDRSYLSSHAPDFDYIVNPGTQRPVTGLSAAASSDNAIVTETMLRVMREGGNAADAGIAGALVQAAVEPFMTNHTGTVTFLCYEAATGELHQLDSAGYLPSGLAPFRTVPQMPTGYAAYPPVACIPGFMPGLKAIHARFASQPWQRLCEDAVRWADDGHPVSSFEYFVNQWGADFTTHLPEGRAFYRPDGHMVPVGHRFRPPGMAETLRRVADEGPDYMITGAWAERFVAKANEMGWAIRLDHMTENPARWIKPFRFPHGAYEVASLNVPQQQGAYLALTLGVLRELGINDVAPESAEHYFYLAHALRLAQLHCGFFIDDSISDPPHEVVLDPDHHRRLARLVKGLVPRVDLSEHVRLTASMAGPGGIYAGAGKPTRARSDSRQPTGSCELSIVDRHGNWVQMMNTLQSGGIPGMVIDGIPMVGAHATFGGLSTAIDTRITKGCRSRQPIGNTLVLREGVPVLSLGSPGNVHCTVPQVITYWSEFGYSAFDSAAAPRLLPIAEDGSILIEDRLSDSTIKGLYALGVNVKVSEAWDFHMGSFQMCHRATDGSLTAIADPRRCGVADGLR